MKVLVTGGTGFIGSHLTKRFADEPTLDVRCALRRPASLPAAVEGVAVGDFGGDVNWRTALAGVDAVVHLAGRAHIMRDTTADPLAEFRRINVAATLNLTRQAVAAGVRRFVFLSSVKVNGEQGTYTEADHPAPVDAYGISKHEAEAGIREIAARTPMEVVIIRAPLVYGAGVGANFARLMRAITRGIPLPLGAIHNRRSLVAADNLVDFILRCIDHPAAANQTFLVSDGEDLSTTALIRRLGDALGRPARLIPVPTGALMTAAVLVGRRQIAARLLQSLQVDISKARRLLGWIPPISVDEGLRRVAAPSR